MLVRTLLEARKRRIITARPNTPVDEAMELLITNKISCLPVLDEQQRLAGIISDKDIFKKIHETGGRYSDLTVGDLMTEAVIIGLPTDEISYIAGVMEKNWIRHVPIVDGNKLIGLVSQRDIVTMQAEHHQIENRYLNLYIEGLATRDESSE